MSGLLVASVACALMLSSCTDAESVDHGTDLPVPVVVDERWEQSGHILKAPPRGFEPAVSFDEAAAVAGGGPVIGGRLGLFTDKSYGYMGKRTIVDVPVWVVTVRRCVPAHGPPGLRNRPHCAVDHLNVVVNAETGNYIQAFAP